MIISLKKIFAVVLSASLMLTACDDFDLNSLFNLPDNSEQTEEKPNEDASTDPSEPDDPVNPVDPVVEEPGVEPNDPATSTTVSFTEMTSDLINPERGLYKMKDFSSSSSALKASEVKAERLNGVALWYLGFYLTDFMKGDISSSYLNKIQSCMDALREGGAKCVLRFAYKSSYSEKEDQDPEVDIVLRHVEQLKPIFVQNEDVIFVLQAGFVGTWGEWYYTTHFVFGPSSSADYQPRKQLTEALLASLPASRQVALRTPQFKMRMYGLSAKDTLTAKTAHDGSAKSRLAGHNDCFGASSSDYGTFDNETKDRDFWKGDSRYTIMGGETCNVSEYCTCTASLKDVEDYHWTYLHNGYNKDVLDRWKTSGCFDEIVARLGYRLVLNNVLYAKDIEAGKECKITINLTNKGYAAPMNPRDFVLVWKTSSGSLDETYINIDPRKWQPGTHTVVASFTPSTTKGTLYLKLSDPLLRTRPEYSIALANEGVFDNSTGMNKLFDIK